MRGIITVFPAGPDPSDASQAVCASRWQVRGTRLFPKSGVCGNANHLLGTSFTLVGALHPFLQTATTRLLHQMQSLLCLPPGIAIVGAVVEGTAFDEIVQWLQFA